jgi:ferritin-like metal-binding protein YciE
MSLKTLRDLYVEELKDLYSAETQLIKALPKMAKAASADSLKQAFEGHLAQTEEHKARLEEVFDGLGVSPKGKRCKAMEGLIAEGAEMIEKKGQADAAVLDAALIAAAQRVEHYEIAVYGTARTFAQLLGENDAMETLQTTLDEEGEADKLLTSIAESEINQEAVHA